MDSLKIKVFFAVLIMCSAGSLNAFAQKAGEWEFGTGGALMNITRISDPDFRTHTGSNQHITNEQNI